MKLAMEHVLMKWTVVESHQSLEPFASTSQVYRQELSYPYLKLLPKMVNLSYHSI